MIFHMTPFLFAHVLISLAGIGSGFVVAFGLLAAKRLDGWTAIFLTTTIATSATGFFLPARHFMPSHAVGIVSLLVLAVAVFARYRRHLAGPWRPAYVTTAVFSQYLNVFVLVAQMFAKVPALKAAAPTQAEPPFLVAQLSVLVFFVGLTLVGILRFRTPAPAEGMPRGVVLGG